MKLITFKAPTMVLALDQVKRRLGSGAVIVQTKTSKRGGILGLGKKNVVEITARSRTDADSTKATRIAKNNRLGRLYNMSKPKPTSSSSRIAKVGYAANDNLPITSTKKPHASALDGAATFNRVASLGKTTAFNKTSRITSLEQENIPIATIVSDPRSLSTQMNSQINDLRLLVENMVKEQRHMHEPQMPEQIFDIYLELIQREVADEIAREMLQRVQQDITGSQASSADLIKQRLVDVMDSMVQAAGPISHNIDGKSRVVAFIGPTGVGKTTTIAKLAADFKLRRDKKVGLITIDTYRIGAVEQLRTYAQIIDVPLKVVVTPTELRDAVAEMQDMDFIFIDTAGRAQTDTLKIQELQAFLTAAKPHEVHLVLSSTSHHSNMLSAADTFKRLGVDRVIFTKLDEAISFGVVLSVMKKLDASLSYITTGQDVPDDIEVGNGRKLAKLLLGLENAATQSKSRSSVSSFA